MGEVINLEKVREQRRLEESLRRIGELIDYSSLDFERLDALREYYDAHPHTLLISE